MKINWTAKPWSSDISTAKVGDYVAYLTKKTWKVSRIEGTVLYFIKDGQEKRWGNYAEHPKAYKVHPNDLHNYIKTE